MTALDKLHLLRNSFQILDKQAKFDFISALTLDEQRIFYKHPDLFLLDKQIIPDHIDNNYWTYYLLRCGRGFGKTFAGSAWVAKKIRQGAKVVGLCGPCYDDVADIMVPAVLKWFLPDELEEIPYNHQRHQIRFRNGAKIHCYTSDKEQKGPNLSYLWNDEIATWCSGIPDKIKERYEDITRSVRVGKHPQTLTTSTPKTHPFFLDFEDKVLAGDKRYVMVQGSMLDNTTLSSEYIQNQIELYGNTSRGRQELYGDLIRDSLGAFWTHSLIDDNRASIPSPLIQQFINKPLTNAQLMGQEPLPPPKTNLPYLVRCGIGFDPSGSVEGDECGIIVAALYSNNQVYVLEDGSNHYKPAEYANKIAELYAAYPCSFVSVESNFGGREAFLYILRTVNAAMHIKTVHTTQGKVTRAEHISSLYNQGKVHHTQTFKQLEDQMCSFSPHYSKSPDRLDALGYVCTELFFPKQAYGSSCNKGGTITGINFPSR